MQWKEVIASVLVVGGELEIITRDGRGEHRLRGPIRAIRPTRDRRVKIELSWIASRTNHEPWKVGSSDQRVQFVNPLMSPVEPSGLRRLEFTLSIFGGGYIHLKGSKDRLNPRCVKGLKLCPARRLTPC